MKLPEPVAQIAFHYARNESNKITVDLPIETRLFTEAQLREALAQQEAENEANERNLCQLTDELAACRKDATRYQWLRSHPIVFGHGSLTVFMDDRCGSGSTHKQVWKAELDAAIDKQLEKEQ